MTSKPIELTEKNHSCACGREDGEPILDARTLPHQIRHGAIFGALESLKAGRSLVLVAPHDPLPLLHQLNRREPDAFEIEYLLNEPGECRLRLTRH